MSAVELADYSLRLKICHIWALGGFWCLSFIRFMRSGRSRAAVGISLEREPEDQSI